MKRCSTCKQVFALTMFGPDKRKRDGFRTQCQTCRRTLALKYTKTEKGKATARKAKAGYIQTAKGRETIKQYKSTEGYREAARVYTKWYRQRKAIKINNFGCGVLNARHMPLSIGKQRKTNSG